MPHMMIPFERLWVYPLAVARPSPGRQASFWVAANEWNGSPAHATMFPSEEAALRQIDDARHHKRAGFSGVAEAVPIEGALKTLGTVVNIRDLGDTDV